jgi:hypothetical protein
MQVGQDDGLIISTDQGEPADFNRCKIGQVCAASDIMATAAGNINIRRLS